MKSGFSLLELLVVILIIGILAAIALPQYQLAVARSRFETLKFLTNSIREAQERYYILYDNYATKITEIDVDFPEGEISADEKRIDFDDGVYCHIYSSANKTKRDIYCANKNITYGIYIGNKNNSGTDYLGDGVDGYGCITKCDNKMYTNICKKISGLENYSYTVGSTCYYRYK